MRAYPALEVTWSQPPDAEAVEGLVLAMIDDDQPLSLEEREDGFRVYFASSMDRDRAAERIHRSGLDASCAAVDVPDEDWAARSQAGLAAVVVDRVIVCPPWDVQRAEGSATVIVQPSTGFGTGHHASTRICIRLLQQVPHLAGASVLDAGTGSGVLAIASALLGARAVVAIDSDPDALQSAAENLVRNDIGDRVELRRVDLASATPIAGAPFDLLLANLTSGLLTRQASMLAALIARGGALIVGGIEAHDSEQVAAAFGAVGCPVVGRDDEQGWAGFILRGPAAAATGRRRT